MQFKIEVQKKQAYLPGLPGASMSVLLTTKVRDKDKGTREGEKR